ncbi:hypothetical protein ACQUSR_33695 [Streptomyces sp. P1-3]|uniref:hypothetical protein n=1 Tax=Streptomyces sp. P1-3 TaxID=3421658 RepID=UPI003D360D7B
MRPTPSRIALRRLLAPVGVVVLALIDIVGPAAERPVADGSQAMPRRHSLRTALGSG